MRTLSITLLALAISACSLYWDDHKTPHISGPTSPDAAHYYPDAHVDDDGGSGCHGSDAYPDAGIWDYDGGSVFPPDAAYVPDAH